MASIRKRGKSWQVQIRPVGCPALTRSFNNKSLAQAWARQKEAESLHDVRSSSPSSPSISPLVYIASLELLRTLIPPSKTGLIYPAKVRRLHATGRSHVSKPENLGRCIFQKDQKST